MKRHQCLVPLSQEHHKGLMLAQLIKKNAPAYRGLPETAEDKLEYLKKEYNTNIFPHFLKEEEILIPLARNHSDSLDKILSEIKIEHDAMHLLINSIVADENMIEKMDEMGNLLEQHIRKEERVLFPLLENVLTEERLQEIFEKLNKSKKDKID